MSQTETELPALLKPEEVGRQLRLSKATVYRLIRLGEFTTVHVGARNATRIPRKSLDAYIERHGVDRAAS